MSIANEGSCSRAKQLTHSSFDIKAKCFTDTTLEETATRAGINLDLHVEGLFL